MPGSHASSGARRVIVNARLAPPRKLDTVPHSQLVVDGTKTPLEDALRGSNFSSDVRAAVLRGDDSDDPVFPVSSVSAPVKIAAESKRLL